MVVLALLVAKEQREIEDSLATLEETVKQAQSVILAHLVKLEKMELLDRDLLVLLDHLVVKGARDLADPLDPVVFLESKEYKALLELPTIKKIAPLDHQDVLDFLDGRELLELTFSSTLTSWLSTLRKLRHPSVLTA